MSDSGRVNVPSTLLDRLDRMDRQLAEDSRRAVPSQESVAGLRAQVDALRAASPRVLSTTSLSDPAATTAAQVVLATLTIPDPGFTYTLLSSGVAEYFTGPGCRYDLSVRLDTAGGSLLAINGVGRDGGSAGVSDQVVCSPGRAAGLKGERVALLVLTRQYGPAGNGVDATPLNGGITVLQMPA